MEQFTFRCIFNVEESGDQINIAQVVLVKILFKLSSLSSGTQCLVEVASFLGLNGKVDHYATPVTY